MSNILRYSFLLTQYYIRLTHLKSKRAKKDRLEEVLEIFKLLKINTPNEPGCLRYELHQDIDNDNVFLFVDRFKDMEAFDSHCQQEYTIKYFDEILPNLTELIEFSLYREINF